MVGGLVRGGPVGVSLSHSGTSLEDPLCWCTQGVQWPAVPPFPFHSIWIESSSSTVERYFEARVLLWGDVDTPIPGWSLFQDVMVMPRICEMAVCSVDPRYEPQVPMVLLVGYPTYTTPLVRLRVMISSIVVGPLQSLPGPEVSERKARISLRSRCSFVRSVGEGVDLWAVCFQLPFSIAHRAVKMAQIRHDPSPFTCICVPGGVYVGPSLMEDVRMFLGWPGGQEFLSFSS